MNIENLVWEKLTPADLDLHTLTPADPDLHTLTSADLHLHTLTSADIDLHLHIRRSPLALSILSQGGGGSTVLPMAGDIQAV